MDYPPAPPGWNKTVDDLMSEMKSGLRESVEGPEFEWARNYETSLWRSQLPKDTRFPRSGDVYEAIDDIEVGYMTHWFAPFTGGGSAVLKQGERVVALDVRDQEPLGIYARPVDYEQLELRMVPEEERARKKYGGFSLAISTRDLNTKFRLIAEGRSS